ncbi:MAG: hypothetical protein ABJF23_23130 [Bryobacteraceae bacterium]
MPAHYAVPWDLVFGLTPYIRSGRVRSVDDFSAAVVRRIQPEPHIEGLGNLPADPRFLLVANHYQRKGLWILHPASVMTQVIRRRYGPGDPPVRWIVTANWPPIRIGKWRLASPGDILLPKVANALACYPVSFARNNPGYTARSLRRILREAPGLERPIGLFPEGVAGTAGRLTEPLPGVARLISHLGKLGMAAVPMGISESDRLVIRIGEAVDSGTLRDSPDAARLLMERIGGLI